MESERFEMRVPRVLLLRVDEARGHESRASFFRRAAVEKLNGSEILRGGVAAFPVSRTAESAYTQAEVVEALPGPVPGLQTAASLVESGGCPECGGQWQRRPDVSGRFCVDCGGREAK